MGPTTLAVLGRTPSDCLALEVMGPTMYSLDRAVLAVEAVGPIFLALENTVEAFETSVEAVAGSVRPPQVLEEMRLQPFHRIQHLHRPQHYDALGNELDLGWRSPYRENNE